jgi:hypothetical protein
LFAALPYTVGKLELAARVQSETGSGRVLRVTGTLADSRGRPVAAAHVISLVVLYPDGSRRPDTPRSVRTRGGRFEMTWHLGLNEPAGRWTILATDVVSGRRERIWVTL